MHNYTSLKEFERLIETEKKRALRQSLLDMLAGAGLAIMIYAFTVIFLSL